MTDIPNRAQIEMSVREFNTTMGYPVIPTCLTSAFGLSVGKGWGQQAQWNGQNSARLLQTGQDGEISDSRLQDMRPKLIPGAAYASIQESKAFLEDETHITALHMGRMAQRQGRTFDSAALHIWLNHPAGDAKSVLVSMNCGSHRPRCNEPLMVHTPAAYSDTKINGLGLEAPTNESALRTSLALVASALTNIRHGQNVDFSLLRSQLIARAHLRAVDPLQNRLRLVSGIGVIATPEFVA